MKVFVYGTLKKGGRLFLKEHARDITQDSIRGDLYRFQQVDFPFADIYGEGTIHGEVHDYAPEMLQVLDRIELRAGYLRERVETHNGEEVYVYHYPLIDRDFTLIESGVWNNKDWRDQR